MAHEGGRRHSHARQPATMRGRGNYLVHEDDGVFEEDLEMEEEFDSDES